MPRPYRRRRIQAPALPPPYQQQRGTTTWVLELEGAELRALAQPPAPMLPRPVALAAVPLTIRRAARAHFGI